MRFAARLSATAVVASVFAALVSASEPAAGTLAAVKARGRLIMVCFPHQDNPFVHVNVAQGAMKKVGTVADFEGVDVDLMSAFAKSLGVELEIRPITTPSYAELIPALLAGPGDVIASSFSITPERAAQVDFSAPYFEVHQAVLALADSKISKAEDLAGKTAAVVAGTAMEARIRGLGIPDERIRREGFSRDALLDVANGDADFTIIELDNYGTFEPLLKAFPKLKVKFRIGGATEFGFAVPRGSDLKPALDAFVAKERSSGELAKFIKRSAKGHK